MRKLPIEAACSELNSRRARNTVVSLEVGGNIARTNPRVTPTARRLQRYAERNQSLVESRFIAFDSGDVAIRCQRYVRVASTERYRRAKRERTRPESNA
ncbi:MAG TPA: hypothetical protein VF210_09485 [Pseudomonadales bacterium]